MFATEFAFQKNVGNQTSATQFLEWHKGVIAIFLMKKKNDANFSREKKIDIPFPKKYFPTSIAYGLQSLVMSRFMLIVFVWHWKVLSIENTYTKHTRDSWIYIREERRK